MGIEIVQDLPEDTWESFVEQHTEGNIFQTPEMFDVFKNANGYEPHLWAAVDSSQEPLAIFTPVNISLTNGLLRYFETRSVSFGSALYTPRAKGSEALKLLLSTYRHNVAKASLFTELRNLSDLREIQPILEEQDFHFEAHLNFRVNLQQSISELKRSMDREVMTNVRRALKSGVTIREITSSDELPSVYSVLKNVFKRVQVPLAPISLFEAAFKILYPRRMIKVLVASTNGTVIGAAVRLLYKDEIFAWYSGALRSYSAFKAHDLLNWHILEWGVENGFKSFDFGGAGKPNQPYGPRNFKAKFGGNLVNFGRNRCVHAPLRLRISNLAYKLYRKML